MNRSKMVLILTDRLHAMKKILSVEINNEMKRV